MRRRRKVATLVMLALVMLALPAAHTGAAAIKLTDYWLSKDYLGKVDIYGYTQPPGVLDFTVAITLVAEGDFFGKIRVGDYRWPDGSTSYTIVYFDNNFIYLYYDKNVTFSPPAQIPITQELETLVPNPANPPNGFWYFKKLAKFTVPAGTYYDVLLKIDLDKSFGRNRANDFFALPSTITYGVTHAEWIALHVGTVQDMDVDAMTGVPAATYVLKSTNAKPWNGTIPVLNLLLLD